MCISMYDHWIKPNVFTFITDRNDLLSTKAGDIRVAIQPFRGMEAPDGYFCRYTKTYRCGVDVLDDLGMPVNFLYSNNKNHQGIGQIQS